MPDEPGPDLEEFLRRWRTLAATWTRTRRRDPQQADELLRTALSSGPPRARGGASASEQDLDRCARALISMSGLFDEEGYAEANGTAIRRGVTPLWHFCTVGWRQLRAPSLGFDLWWYWTEHLDPTRETVNPLVHYLLEGRRRGYSPVQPRHPNREPTRPAQPVRRVCLFAGYDRDGLIDDYVVALITELARFADVYYLADGFVTDTQLDRLKGITKGAWSLPHGAYDFGSVSILAKDLVGWSTIESYDELIMANDSCFLLRSMDEVFARMDATATDWWGLQATSTEFDEDDAEQLGRLLTLAEAKERFIGPQRWSDVDYLHLSSYLLVFRRPVIDDPGFRRRLDTVTSQAEKLLVVHKYECGISRYLMAAGFDFATFIPQLYPFHPLYNESYFDLLVAGFPLVKRNFLAENAINVPYLENWPTRITELVPEAPIEMMTANITRVAPDDLLQRAHSVTVNEAGQRVTPAAVLRPHAFFDLDLGLPEHDHWWAFPVDPVDHRLSDNSRAVFEIVRDDPTVRKVVLTASRRVSLPGENVSAVPLRSLKGQEQLVRCGQILINHLPRVMVPFPLTGRWHNFIHLGTGPAFGPCGVTGSVDPALTGMLTDNARIRAMVTSSPLDTAVKLAGFQPLAGDRIWRFGLPRHSLLLCPEEQLPTDLRADLDSIRDRAQGRRLVVFWPEPRVRDHHEFSDADLTRLLDWCRATNSVLGIRESLIDRRRSYSRRLCPAGAIDLSTTVESPMMLLRAADLVVTDYDETAVDFALTGRPLVHLVPDLEQRTQLHGAFLDPATLLPGRICTSTAELLDALDAAEGSAAATRLFPWSTDDSARKTALAVRGLYADPTKGR